MASFTPPHPLLAKGHCSDGGGRDLRAHPPCECHPEVTAFASSTQPHPNLRAQRFRKTRSCFQSSPKLVSILLRHEGAHAGKCLLWEVASRRQFPCLLADRR